MAYSTPYSHFLKKERETHMEIEKQIRDCFGIGYRMLAKNEK